MAGIPTPVSPTGDELTKMLSDNQFGDLVGLRPIIDSAPDHPVFRGWFVAGTIGYIELDADHVGVLAGVWRPAETYGI